MGREVEITQAKEMGAYHTMNTARKPDQGGTNATQQSRKKISANYKLDITISYIKNWLIVCLKSITGVFLNNFVRSGFTRIPRIIPKAREHTRASLETNLVKGI
jgi:hypothetical protein